MRAPHASQLQVERDEVFNFSKEEPITDQPGSVTVQIVAEIERGTNTDEESNTNIEENSSAESISDRVGSIVSYFELFNSIFTTLYCVVFVYWCCI